MTIPRMPSEEAEMVKLDACNARHTFAVLEMKPFPIEDISWVM